MKFTNSKAVALLVSGDLLSYILSLILTLTVRYGELPSRGLFVSHAPSFSLLFVIFLLVSYGGGLYDKQTYFMRDRIESLIVKVQLINLMIGVFFFYFTPAIIAPKANLFIYILISTALILIWRDIMFPVLSSTRNAPAIMVGVGDDIDDLHEEINTNGRYGIVIREKIAPLATVEETVATIGGAVERVGPQIVIADLRNPTLEKVMPFLYSLIFSGVQVLDASKLYETVFDRIPLSLVGEKWLVENAASSLGGRKVYDSLKRLTDVFIGAVGMLITAVAYPFIFVAIKLEDRGPIFIKQERIGKNAKRISIVKFRSMTANDNGAYSSHGKSDLKITRVGKFIRLTRIDELPQSYNIFMGDLAFIGPRPELPALVDVYENKVPYYGVRHLIKPGLSGWAQIYHHAHPHHAVAVDETRDKLSYDLFYIKNRSLGLDMHIALQTVRALLSRQGV
ncbi:MAG: sugar transferase [Candidatus Paceibacterota bacterium]